VTLKAKPGEIRGRITDPGSALLSPLHNHSKETNSPTNLIRSSGACSMNLNRATINRIFIVLVVFSNTFGNFLLAKGMHQMPDFMTVPFLSYAASISTNLYIIGGVALLVAWMIAQLSMFTWADLSYVLPVTASGYVLTALLSKFFLGEHISAARWTGIVFITIGSMLVSMTPLRTKARGREYIL
jgi:uncharacterized membrane protein